MTKTCVETQSLEYIGKQTICRNESSVNRTAGHAGAFESNEWRSNVKKTKSIPYGNIPLRPNAIKNDRHIEGEHVGCKSFQNFELSSGQPRVGKKISKNLKT